MQASPQPLIEYLLLEALAPLLPAAAFVNLTLDYFGKYTMMMSNVMGPQSVAHMGGRAIDSISALAATSIGLYAGMLSYNGRLGSARGRSVQHSPVIISVLACTVTPPPPSLTALLLFLVLY